MEHIEREVVIIGAGATGLTVANRLQDAGKSYVVLEALGGPRPHRWAAVDRHHRGSDVRDRRTVGVSRSDRVPRDGSKSKIRHTLEGYTTHAAIAQGDHTTVGRIAAGYRADFTAFSIDPPAAPPDELAEAPTVAMIVGGEFTHRAI